MIGFCTQVKPSQAHPNKSTMTLTKIHKNLFVDLMPSYYPDQISSRNLMEESRPFPRLGSPSDSTASSPTPSSVESYGERDIGVHPGEKVFNFPTNSNNESGGPVTLTGLTPISPSNEVSTDHNVSSLSPKHPQDSWEDSRLK